MASLLLLVLGLLTAGVLEVVVESVVCVLDRMMLMSILRRRMLTTVRCRTRLRLSPWTLPIEPIALIFMVRMLLRSDSGTDVRSIT